MHICNQIAIFRKPVSLLEISNRMGKTSYIVDYVVEDTLDTEIFKISY